MRLFKLDHIVKVLHTCQIYANITVAIQKIFVIVYSFLCQFLCGYFDYYYFKLLWVRYWNRWNQDQWRFNQMPKSGYGFVNGSDGFTETGTETRFGFDKSIMLLVWFCLSCGLLKTVEWGGLPVRNMVICMWLVSICYANVFSQTVQLLPCQGAFQMSTFADFLQLYLLTKAYYYFYYLYCLAVATGKGEFMHISLESMMDGKSYIIV